jgi:hypothetical protein
MSDHPDVPDPACHEIGWDARFIDGMWRVGMWGNLDTKHDAVISVNQHTSDGEEAKRIAFWIRDQYNAALGMPRILAIRKISEEADVDE